MARVKLADSCAHGNDIRDTALEVPAGAVVWSPACVNGRGEMRPHVITTENPGGRPRD